MTLAPPVGHVPAALAVHYPDHNFTTSSPWCNFPPQFTGDVLLEPTDPLYVQLGAAFHALILEDYGDPTGLEHPVFNADMCVLSMQQRLGVPTALSCLPHCRYNEMTPNSGDLAYLKACNEATYAAMIAANPNALYLMQVGHPPRQVTPLQATNA